MNKLKILQQWNSAAKVMHADIQRYLDVTMCAPEAPHVDSPYATLTAYTKLVGELTGIDHDSLMDWVFECNFGEIAFQVKEQNDDEWQRITTIEALYDFYKGVTEEWPCDCAINNTALNGSV